jgi:3-dehydroquinate dehydratase/shikimate dehydrogenase
VTLIACPIFVSDVAEVNDVLDRAARAAAAGARLVEWRVDALVGRDGAAGAIATLLAEALMPCILTCRPSWEGGTFDGDDEDRIEMLEAAIASDAPPKYVDLELRLHQERPELSRRVVDAIGRANGDEGVSVGLILSAHDFNRRPIDLIQKIEAMANEPACSIIKVAWFARSLRDNLEAFTVLRERTKPTIALCMGELGVMSRVLAPKFGGFLTFASLSRGGETAAGQPTIADLLGLFHFDTIGPATEVYGVIGWPVAHSLSPKIHNAGFEGVGHDGVYLPLPVPPEYEHFQATVGALLDDATLDFRGASVTIPHKEHLLQFAMERGGAIEPLALGIGAGNTLTVHDDGAIEASNTDCAAAIKALCARMDIEFGALAGKTVAVLGAGGVARGIMAGLAQLGAQITIFNRTRARAVELMNAFAEMAPIAIGDPAQLGSARFDIYINCTPLGMAGTEFADASPLPDDALLDGAVVMDTVYNPVDTPLLKQAEAAGAKTLDGLAMFVRQAGTQFKHWTGQALPVDVMDVAGRD